MHTTAMMKERRLTFIAVFLCVVIFSFTLPIALCKQKVALGNEEVFFKENEVKEGASDGYFLGELLASFSTDFGFSSSNRRHNVKKATSLIDGTVLKEGEVFSFNAITGERTLANGYKESATIEGGKYTTGVGGGVCQVSTTLYNAVLLSGLRVERVSPHSLPVGYVPHSMDAMVSSATDFRFFNDTPYPITIRGEVKGDTLTFKIFGFKIITDGESVRYLSKVIKRIPMEYDEVLDEGGALEENEEYKILKRAKEGVVSECYKETYYNGELISSVLIRRDYYKPERGIKLVRVKSLESENSLEEAK